MTIRRDNPRIQGDIGLGAAIAYFLGEGYDVAVPLGESQPWDLIIEARGERRVGPERVQVKTTTFRDPRGQFVVHIATNGGNQSWTGVVRRFDPTLVEWLFVLTDDGDRYLIPSGAISATTALTLGRWMDRYLVDSILEPLPLNGGRGRGE